MPLTSRNAGFGDAIAPLTCRCIGLASIAETCQASEYGTRLEVAKRCCLLWVLPCAYAHCNDFLLLSFCVLLLVDILMKRVAVWFAIVLM